MNAGEVGPAGTELKVSDAKSVAGRVFDADGNAVPAQLLVWGPTAVDGELCMVARPTGFEVTEPNENYDGDRHAVNAADDVQVAVPMRPIQGDERTEEEPGGPAMVGGYVRLPGHGDGYRWLSPADVARLFEASRRVVDEEREGGASEEASRSWGGGYGRSGGSAFAQIDRVGVDQLADVAQDL